jgi:hypothetical protein
MEEVFASLYSEEFGSDENTRGARALKPLDPVESEAEDLT